MMLDMIKWARHRDQNIHGESLDLGRKALISLVSVSESKRFGTLANYAE